jgi:hypothetical protein
MVIREWKGNNINPEGCLMVRKCCLFQQVAFGPSHSNIFQGLGSADVQVVK